VTQADNKHLTVVCYRSGYGGDFLCALLDEAFGNNKFIQRDLNNRYLFDNYVFASFNDQLKSLNVIFSYYYGEDVNFVDSLVGKVKWIDGIKRIYNMCYDEDENIFIDNIMEYIKQSLYLPHQNNVGNLHINMGEFSFFDVRKIHNPISVIFLRTKSELYYQYFHAFSHIKTNFNVLKNTKVLKKERFNWEPLPYAVEVDVGQLFFEDTLDDTISETLSNIVGKQIIIDLNELKKYRADNDKLLIKYFGSDYKSLDLEAFKKKKLELYDRVRKGEAY